MIRTVMKVEGMMCGMCEAHICDVIRRTVPSAKKVKASRMHREASFLSQEEPDAEALAAAVNATGYTCSDVKFEPYEKRAGWRKK